MVSKPTIEAAQKKLQEKFRDRLQKSEQTNENNVLVGWNEKELGRVAKRLDPTFLRWYYS